MIRHEARPHSGRNAAVAGVSLLPLFALAWAALDGAVVFAAGEIVKLIGGR